MIKLTTFTQFEWIQEETNRNKVGFISNVIPNRYHYFCKILHPIYRDKNIKDERLLWSQCDPDEEVQFNIGERLWFKDLAKKYNIEYTNSISSRDFFRSLGGYPRYMVFPDEGSMELNEVGKIVSVLQPFTQGEKCYFYYDLLKTVNIDPVANGYLYFGDLKDLIDLSKQPHGSATYWWNQSKTWCLYTDYDLDYSIVGGKKEVIESLLSDDSLECIEIGSVSILGN
ncbi:hypothetical protein KDN24_10555 [Bacillus sp. Bva_UNVM-123]|uniref:hypothetical protein n=1 Tax=Bacillus sp. Bva_UNVM-123 TaxID=2829798 RepID=UPI00391EF085